MRTQGVLKSVISVRARSVIKLSQRTRRPQLRRLQKALGNRWPNLAHRSDTASSATVQGRGSPGPVKSPRPRGDSRRIDPMAFDRDPQHFADPEVLGGIVVFLTAFCLTAQVRDADWHDQVIWFAQRLAGPTGQGRAQASLRFSTRYPQQPSKYSTLPGGKLLHDLQSFLHVLSRRNLVVR